MLKRDVELQIREGLKLLSHDLLPEFRLRLESFSTFEFQVEEYQAMLDKPRWLYRAPAEIFLLEKLLSLILAEAVEPLLSDSVMSFRKERGPALAAERAYKKSEALFSSQSAREKGLFVLRRDIKSYTDEIPLGDTSPLWKMLQKLAIPLPMHDLIKACLRPQIAKDALAGERMRWRGIPTGSTLTPILANFYLSEFDQWILSYPGVFYERYGDDLLILHSDRTEIEKIRVETNSRLYGLGLRFNEDKLKNIFFSPSGSSHRSDSVYQNSSSIDYLGIRIQAGQGLRLNTDKMRNLVRGFVSSLKTTRELLVETESTLPKEEIAKTLVMAANHYFSRKNADHRPELADLYQWVTDLRQLKELDDFVARTLTQTIYETVGTKAYRFCSWKDLIQKYGWKSPTYLWRRRR